MRGRADLGAEPSNFAADARAIDDSGLDDVAEARRRCEAFRGIFARLRAEVGKSLVGQREVVDLALVTLFADGHLLLEGVPGLGKTLLVRSLAAATGLGFSRIQFTPDVMPADITGTSILVEDEATGRREIQFRKGPLFAQLVLADEVNRASPKTQSALLEAMQERSVTVGGETRSLGRPFFVMATQNPIEQEGTFPLPEAQLDRFLLKVEVPPPDRETLREVLERTTRTETTMPSQVVDARTIVAAQKLARRIPMAPEVQDWIVRLVMGTHPDGDFCAEENRELIRIGASPRAAQAIAGCARVVALMAGRYAVGFGDARKVARAALRHRIHRSFAAESRGISADEIARRVIAATPTDPALVAGAAKSAVRMKEGA
ncbi:MAG: AAA family ATPase [Phycisphaerales bacterium]|jgi:MoxR-like ATPase